MIRPPPTSTRFPYTTLFRSSGAARVRTQLPEHVGAHQEVRDAVRVHRRSARASGGGASAWPALPRRRHQVRSEEHTSELQSRPHLVCRLLLEKKKKKTIIFV